MALDERRLVKISRYLSKHLRHRPERLGLSLGPGGWVDVDVLLAACADHQFSFTRDELDEVVARNDKRRYAYDDTGTRIRASQGHSVDVDLGLPQVAPPDMLYHGTATTTLDTILAHGLSPMGRQHVHLSADQDTAVAVGSRHGRPTVLAIDAAAMHRTGYAFHRSDNGVWLTGHVPVRYLRTAGR